MTILNDICQYEFCENKESKRMLCVLRYYSLQDKMFSLYLLVMFQCSGRRGVLFVEIFFKTREKDNKEIHKRMTYRNILNLFHKNIFGTDNDVIFRIFLGYCNLNRKKTFFPNR